MKTKKTASSYKEIVWIGSSKKDIYTIPDYVRKEIGHGLYLAQTGDMHRNAKPLKGFGNAGIIEIIIIEKDGTYRAVYTVTMPKFIYVLHIFQKKSKHGIETPNREIELIKSRLKEAQIKYYNKR